MYLFFLKPIVRRAFTGYHTAASQGTTADQWFPSSGWCTRYLQPFVARYPYHFEIFQISNVEVHLRRYVYCFFVRIHRPISRAHRLLFTTAHYQRWGSKTKKTDYVIVINCKGRQKKINGQLNRMIRPGQFQKRSWRADARRKIKTPFWTSNDETPTTT